MNLHFWPKKQGGPISRRGKTCKTAILPGFCGIEHVGGSGSTPAMGGFICTSPSWLSITSSSCQYCWTRMASQMIECYQFRCHLAESKRWPILVLSLLRFSEMTAELTSSKYFELNVNWFLNLLVCNVVEREIEREKVQTKSPFVSLLPTSLSVIKTCNRGHWKCSSYFMDLIF